MTKRRNRIRRADLVWGLIAGVMAVLFVVYALPAVPSLQPPAAAGFEGGKTAGHSVHAKNKPTPDWILELQTRNARQLPVTVQSDSFWI